MLALRELQRAFAAGMVSGEVDAIAALIQGGAVAPENRLRIHRNTMRGALANALRLSFPAVAALVGGEFFAQAVAEFARRHPPRGPLLTLYGAEFPEFLAAYIPASGLAYLADVARLEWAVDQTAGAAEGDASPAITVQLPGVVLTFARSLSLLHCDYPAEAIWRAVLAADEVALAGIAGGPTPTRLAVWHDGDGAEVTAIGPIAANFLDRLLAGGDAETALAAAATDPAADPVAAISREILSAGFVRLTPLR